LLIANATLITPFVGGFDAAAPRVGSIANTAARMNIFMVRSDEEARIVMNAGRA
jgi:hypothetical protein